MHKHTSFHLLLTKHSVGMSWHPGHQAVAAPARAIRQLRPIHQIDEQGQLLKVYIEQNPTDVYLPGYVPRDAEAFRAFVAVDRDRSGSIDWSELQAALKAGHAGNVFSDTLCKLLIRVWDGDGNRESLGGAMRERAPRSSPSRGSVLAPLSPSADGLEFHEFELLYQKVQKWQSFYSAHLSPIPGTSVMGLTLEALRDAVVFDRCGGPGPIPLEFTTVALDSVQTETRRNGVQYVTLAEFYRLMATMESVKRLIGTFTHGNMGQAELKVTQSDLFSIVFFSRS